MVPSVVKICFFITCCGVLILNGVESNLNIDNGEDIFIPYGSKDLKPSKIDDVIKNWERDDGVTMFNIPNRKPKSSINKAIVSDWKHDNGIALYVPPNTNLGATNQGQINKELLSDGEDLFNPEDMISSQNSIRSRAIRNYGRGETFRW